MTEQQAQTDPAPDAATPITEPSLPAPVPAGARWAGWAAACALVLVVLALRLLYLRYGSPYELVEDEAHYWDWSRRLALSYYTKGPGVAWTIAASTALLGVSEFAVRAPAAIAGAIGALATGALAADASRDRRAAFAGAVAWSIAPMTIALGLLMTIDGPYLACWAVAAWLGWLAIDRRSGPALAGCAAALGACFLYKYTALLLAPGLLLAWLLLRRRAERKQEESTSKRGRWTLVASGVFFAAISPVLIWNTLRGWPTVRHLLEHLGSGGSAPAAEPSGWDPLWTLELLGAQVGLLGLAAPLVFIALWRALRRGAPSALRRGAVFAVCCAAPTLLFYLAVSLRAEPEGNWPGAAWVTMLALVGMAAPSEVDRYRALVREWRADPARPKRGLLRRAPETPFQVSWHWAIGAGIVVGVVLLRLDLLAHVPLVGRIVPIHRLTGAQERADVVQGLVERARQESGQEPFIASLSYGDASHMAFYLPGRPAVRCARSVLGGQPSQYDFFEDTRFVDPRTGATEPALLGRPAALVGGDEAFWSAAFDRLEAAGDLDALSGPSDQGKRSLFIGYGFRGWEEAGR